MDTEIFYKYKDGLHPDVKNGSITLDKGLYKRFTDKYETKHDDAISKLSRRLWNCHLVSKGNHSCQAFLDDILEFWKSDELGFGGDDIEKFKIVYEFLKKQDIIEITFTMF